VAQGASQTLKSRHLIGEAVDLAPYPIDWNDLSRFRKMADVIKNSSDILDIPIEWGGDWKTLVDMPHFQLKH
ncbi:UNVERIFIED_CONTAM: M15 family metallopeptidase, partial [Kocuria sp. CPCC 205274]